MSAQSKAENKLKKDDKKKELQELIELFKPVVAQKISQGADPKSVVCAFFKQGQCTKGDKCPNVTKITLESFLAWEKRKRQEKIDKLEQDMERRKADFKAGKANDDEEADDTCYTQRTGGDEVDDSVSVNDIDVSLYIPRDADETGITVASLERFSTYTSDKDENKLSEASGGRAENGERSDLEENNERKDWKTELLMLFLLMKIFSLEKIWMN
ncbi:hypothetical protein P7K49_023514 [Saguinus oedipus]|uniref:C3H1-type domain-containing protein n=1 Tax=Saguinus oedipus TaxID=9490 RepID=A0ABQ9UNG2_SAGOE|nr:hypothetical protein P7K49_023514 [Saguinus oedipus]